jgi:hypothetical protein
VVRLVGEDDNTVYVISANMERLIGGDGGRNTPQGGVGDQDDRQAEGTVCIGLRVAGGSGGVDSAGGFEDEGSLLIAEGGDVIVDLVEEERVGEVELLRYGEMGRHRVVELPKAGCSYAGELGDMAGLVDKYIMNLELQKLGSPVVGVGKSAGRHRLEIPDAFATFFQSFAEDCGNNCLANVGVCAVDLEGA